MSLDNKIGVQVPNQNITQTNLIHQQTNIKTQQQAKQKRVNRQRQILQSNITDINRQEYVIIPTHITQLS